MQEIIIVNDKFINDLSSTLDFMATSFIIMGIFIGIFIMLFFDFIHLVYRYYMFKKNKD